MISPGYLPFSRNLIIISNNNNDTNNNNNNNNNDVRDFSGSSSTRFLLELEFENVCF